MVSQRRCLTTSCSPASGFTSERWNPAKFGLTKQSARTNMMRSKSYTPKYVRDQVLSRFRFIARELDSCVVEGLQLDVQILWRITRELALNIGHVEPEVYCNAWPVPVSRTARALAPCFTVDVNSNGYKCLHSLIRRISILYLRDPHAPVAGKKRSRSGSHV